MFGIGVSEIITIIIVLLVIINPKDLPKITRKAGNIYANIMRQINRLRKTYKEFSDEIETLSEIDDIKK